MPSRSKSSHHKLSYARAAVTFWLTGAWLVLLPLAQPLAGTVVLCVGQDGHVSTEGASGFRCFTGGDAGAVDLAAFELGPVSEHSIPACSCGPCTDLPYPAGGDVNQAATKVNDVPQMLVNPLTLGAPRALGMDEPTSQRGRFQVVLHPAEPSSLAPLRSTVLLI